MKHTPFTEQQIDVIMLAAAEVFPVYKRTTAEQRARFLEAIAGQIEALGDALILKASEETNLPIGRLVSERGRTTMQLRAFAAMLREGSWVEASIDTAIHDRPVNPKPDLRKWLVPMGPVVVFGPGNFPFAYSTAGGDTASALSAGCPVVVKAHPGHSETSEMVSQAVKSAILITGMAEGVFQHVHGDNETGRALVQHPATAAVGFTGSLTGGKALVNYVQERKNMIPVFSEMSSINPVLFLPDALEKNTVSLAKSFGASITLNMGQFCTNPGMLIGVESDSLLEFLSLLNREIDDVNPVKMLNANIYHSYHERRRQALDQRGVKHEDSGVIAGEMEGLPSIATVDAKLFLENPVLQEEVFGPFSLLVTCKNTEELKMVWRKVSGQLTTTLIGTETDFNNHPELLPMAEEIAGRIIFNGVPTGVEVCASMVHGGPYPATTDSRFTAVGIQSVKRWVRPVCYQNCPDDLLPIELRNANEKNIWRLVNNDWTKNAI